VIALNGFENDACVPTVDFEYPEDGDEEPVATRDRWTDAPLYEKCQRRFATVSRDPDLLFPMLEMRLTVLREAITEAVKRMDSRARPVSLLIAVAILACGLPPALMVRERTFEQSGAKFDFRDGLRLVLANRPFLLLLFAYVVILCGLFIGGSFGLYVNIFHVFGGDKTAAATISGISGTVTAAAAYASIFLATWTATHFGKKTAMLWGLGFGTLGGASMWFTMTPSAPYAQLISAALIGLGLQGCWLMVSSMTADICDLDELQTGLRRKGLFSALVGFVQKAAFALIALAGGVFLSLAGYVESAPPGPDVIFRMRVFLVAFMVLGLGAGIAVMSRYPITRERAEETRRLLDEKNRLKSS
jgi:GPH family glycoside/pentoside/hexuronide:cation symporter